MSTRRLLLIWALLLAGLVCITQQPTSAYWQSRDSNYNIAISGGAPAYTGIGDILAQTFWGGFRAYSSATRGTKAINACIPADAACADLSTDATTGLLVVSTIGGSSCSVVTCTIKTLYDKASTNDATQATIGSRPTLTANSLNTAWCMTFAGGQALIGVNYTSSQPYSMLAVTKPTSNTGDQGIMGVDNGTFAGGILNHSSTGNFQIYSGNTIAAATTLNTWHAYQGVFNGVLNGVNAQDGSEVTGDGGSQSLTAYPLNIGQEGTASQPYTGLICEVGYLNAGYSGANRTAMNTNMHGAYGGF